MNAAFLAIGALACFTLAYRYYARWLERRVYQAKPCRHEYRLTEKGRDLYPLIMALVRWGDRWHDDGSGAPIEHLHKGCQHVMHADIVCSECGKPLHPHDVDVRLGPALRDNGGRHDH